MTETEATTLSNYVSYLEAQGISASQHAIFRAVERGVPKEVIASAIKNGQLFRDTGWDIAANNIGKTVRWVAVEGKTAIVYEGAATSPRLVTTMTVSKIPTKWVLVT